MSFSVIIFYYCKKWGKINFPHILGQKGYVSGSEIGGIFRKIIISRIVKKACIGITQR